MSEILLSISAGGILATRNGGISVPDLAGVKILSNERYNSSVEKNSRPTFNYAGACALFHSAGARNIVLDSKLSGDNADEMKEAVDATLKLENGKRVIATHMTADYFLPGHALRTFAELMDEYMIKPILVLPTSRFTDTDYKRFSPDAEALVAQAAIFTNSIGATLMVGAIDAKIGKAAEPDCPIIGLGAALTEEEGLKGGHSRPALIRDVAPYVDIFNFGRPIFDSVNPSQAVDLRQVEISNSK